MVIQERVVNYCSLKKKGREQVYITMCYSVNRLKTKQVGGKTIQSVNGNKDSREKKIPKNCSEAHRILLIDFKYKY